MSDVAQQTYNNYEHIIIDGASTDGSKSIIEQYKNKNPHVTYWVSEKDEGIYNAMNKGITHAQGQYLLFLNSGDYIEPNILEQAATLSSVWTSPLQLLKFIVIILIFITSMFIQFYYSLLFDILLLFEVQLFPMSII